MYLQQQHDFEKAVNTYASCFALTISCFNQHPMRASSVMTPQNQLWSSNVVWLWFRSSIWALTSFVQGTKNAAAA